MEKIMTQQQEQQQEKKGAEAPVTPAFNRGAYGEIPLSQLPESLSTEVKCLVEEAGNAAKVDEHGSWGFGIEWDSRKGRGTSLNWDLYGIGRDVHTGQLLIAIQIRQFHRRKATHFPQVRKNYFLVGKNEDGSAFAHPVSSSVIHAAIRKGNDVITRVQTWVFGFDYSKLIRQGDVALIPMSRRPAAPKIAKRTATVNGTHALKADLLLQNGNLYAKSPQLVHIPGTHPKVEGEKGRWYRVATGERADFWKFAAPTID
jgi:hypothetical protein